ncbi:uncharacterized protein RAG0_05521 [Rhynchosporium agropyri]|uniref:Uncharacterized protein n=1 Tax=Rhynchosporium agropyri TaxID=914238 RepID=A0A1E1KDG6_9HELO|nr:uncharacterized protein RAG0_05521 [Rhynchosporium agropyri]
MTSAEEMKPVAVPCEYIPATAPWAVHVRVFSNADVGSMEHDYILLKEARVKLLPVSVRYFYTCFIRDPVSTSKKGSIFCYDQSSICIKSRQVVDCSVSSRLNFHHFSFSNTGVLSLSSTSTTFVPPISLHPPPHIQPQYLVPYDIPQHHFKSTLDPLDDYESQIPKQSFGLSELSHCSALELARLSFAICYADN